MISTELAWKFFRRFIDGFETGAPGGAATLTIGPGACVDNTNAALMKVTSSYTKTMGSWAVGSGNGGLDTGSVAASTAYFGYVIQRTDTGVTDYLISLSSSSPTLPASYTVVRGPVSWFKTDSSSHIWQFQQRGDEFIYGVSVADVSSGAVPSGSRSLVTLTVPLGFVVKAAMRVALASGTSGTYLTLTSPDETDQGGASAGFADVSSNSTIASGARVEVRTNTSAQIGARGHTTDTYSVNTFGFTWTRGRNS